MNLPQTLTAYWLETIWLVKFPLLSQHHFSLLFLLSFLAFFSLSVTFSFLNLVSSPPQTESQWPVDFGGTRMALADPPINQPTNLPRRSHFPLAPPFISPTAAPNWPIASQCFSWVSLPASCYQPWPLTSWCPWVDLWPAYHREEHLLFVCVSLCGVPPASQLINFPCKHWFRGLQPQNPNFTTPLQ